jgi:hypothetical protein
MAGRRDEGVQTSGVRERDTKESNEEEKRKKKKKKKLGGRGEFDTTCTQGRGTAHSPDSSLEEPLGALAVWLFGSQAASDCDYSTSVQAFWRFHIIDSSMTTGGPSRPVRRHSGHDPADAADAAAHAGSTTTEKLGVRGSLRTRRGDRAVGKYLGLETGRKSADVRHLSCTDRESLRAV